MAKTITIAPVTRIEGHAKVTINLDDAGNVADTYVNVVELRGFEKFCVGRPVEELPRIVTSICGVCPWSHHLASAKANDAIFGVEPPPTGRKLRELCNAVAFTEEHILHFFFLAGPDYVMGPDADYSIRNVLGILQADRELGRRVVRARHLGSRMLGILSGKSIHPVTAVPGGFSKPLAERDRDRLASMAQEVLDFAKFAIGYAKEEIFPNYAEEIRDLGTIETGFLGTVAEDGSLDLYDGRLRLMKPDGTAEDFAYDQYDDVIVEHVEPWSYLKFPYIRAWGEFSMDIDRPVGIYRTNTLARLNVADRISTPLAQAELEAYRKAFGRPVQQTLRYNHARLIELLYNAELAVQLLEDPAITGRDTRVPVTPRAARGVGCVEAPRGTLIHDYQTDDEGMVTDVNLIVGTTHNNAPINMSVNQAAKRLISAGVYDETILNKIEMAIRAYDPCLSCATHNLDGTIALTVKIVARDGGTIANLSNVGPLRERNEEEARPR
ncbi:MAG: Ni/Fe hydrogenase subunit alpha [Candidatus Bipolaricaulota bacterium]|nr:MAG: Ni/Fe hydrogenase subunit alpha [Candidatus Bipolaricaulota bacterium]